jgi:cobalt-zinc-cadmium efflux system outer membrane protein
MLYLGASSRSELGPNDQDFQISQPLDLFGKRRANQQSGKAIISQAEAELLEVTSQVQREVLEALVEAKASQQTLEATSELLKLADSFLVASKRRFEEGKVAETQVLRASIERERARQSNELSSSHYRIALEKLSGVVGTKLDSAEADLNAKLGPIATPVSDQRPDIRVIRAELAVAESEVELAHASKRPDLNAMIVRSPFSSDPGYFGARIQLSWQINDNGRSRSLKQAASFMVEAARRKLRDATLRAESEISAATLLVQAKQAQILSYEAILASAKQLVSKSQKGYVEGFNSQIEVLEATRALREIELDYIEAQKQLELAVIAQYKATGYIAEGMK